MSSDVSFPRDNERRGGDVAAPIRDEAVDPIVALREKWEREPTDAEGWEKRAARALGLAERWRTNAVEWERLARKEAENHGR